MYFPHGGVGGTTDEESYLDLARPAHEAFQPAKALGELGGLNTYSINAYDGALMGCRIREDNHPDVPQFCCQPLVMQMVPMCRCTKLWGRTGPAGVI